MLSFQKISLSLILGSIFLGRPIVSQNDDGLFLHPLSVDKSSNKMIDHYTLTSSKGEIVKVEVYETPDDMSGQQNQVSKIKSAADPQLKTNDENSDEGKEKKPPLHNDKNIDPKTGKPYLKLDLTPAKCNSKVCYAGSFQRPQEADCNVIVDAQFISIGSLTAYPGTYVLVYHGTCAIVFNNPDRKHNPYALDYNWAMLGPQVVNLMKKCFKTEEQSIGGACLINEYNGYKFKNVRISLQRAYTNSSGLINP